MTKLKKYFFSFLLIFNVLQLFSTNQIDSLKNICLKAKNTKKVNAILRLRENNQSNNINKSYKYAKDALFLSKKTNYKLGMAIAYNNIGYSLTDLGRYNDALENYHKGILMFKKLGRKNREAIAYNDVAYIYQCQGLIKKAIDTYIKSLKILEKVGDKSSTASCLNNIGLLYQSQKNYTKALEFYKKGLAIKNTLGNEKSIAVSLNNIGSLYFDKEDYVDAQTYFFKSLAKRKATNDKAGIAQCLINIAAIYRVQKKYDTALEYLLQSKKIQIEIHNKIGLVNSLNNIGVIYRLKNDLTNAKKYLLKSYNLAHEIGAAELIKNTSVSLSNLYLDLHQYKAAYPLIVEHFKMKDSIENSAITRKLNQAGLQYEFEKRLHKSKLAQIKKNHEHEIELKEQKYITYTFAIGLIAFIILSTVVLKSLKDKKNANKKIIAHQKVIEEKSLKLEEALTNITDSVIYAKRIQEALLQAENHITKHIPQHFIFFQPKDIVSGDFYWSHEKNGLLYIAAVDCTGHGVPGALMSMLGFSFLNSINAGSNIFSPAEILNKLRAKVIIELGQNAHDGKSRDGMDISLVKINLKTLELEWAGANNNLWFISNNNIVEFKADRQSINFNDNPKTYTNHYIKAEKGDKFYMFTDGFADQFGGPKGKKLKQKQFKEYIFSLHNKNMKEQHQLINTFFSNWKGKLSQIDDVCVIGIKV